MRKRYNEFLQTLRGLMRLARRKQLAWLIRFVDQRAIYKINALYAGILMNRRGKGDIYNLRRNIHRLEKGLIRNNLKQVFAEDYIYETVSYLLRLENAGDCDDNTLLWAKAVLEQYFSICDHVGKISKAFNLFKQLSPTDKNGLVWCPYPARNRPDANVDYESLHQLAIRRRSIRHYLNEPVQFEVIQKAMEIAALSPGACNRQSFQFLFYDKKEVVKSICAIAGGYAGFEAPSLVVVLGRYRGYFDERDANVPIIDASLAVMAFSLALETLGLSSVCMNWPLLPSREENLRGLIHLDEDEFVVMLIGIGYADPDGKVAYSAKRDINSLITCNERITGDVTVMSASSDSSMCAC